MKPGFDAHRAAGVLLGMACGDALGAPDGPGPAVASETEGAMIGGTSGREPGEWTDTTEMALVIAQAIAAGSDLHDLAGNCSLTGTAPIALAHLDDERGLIEASTRGSAATCPDPEAGEACVLWGLAISHAVTTGRLDLRRGLRHLDPARSAVWSRHIDTAERSVPADFTNSGLAVEALQGAWCAIHTTRGLGSHAADHLRLAIEAAVCGGGDSDAVAAIAGGLLGAAYGASAIPACWRRVVHGGPGLRARDLISLAVLIAGHGRPDPQGWPTVDQMSYDPSAHQLGRLARHPHDSGVWLGGIDALRNLPPEVDAVVSLCRLGAGEVPAPGVAPVDHLEVYLIDSSRPETNPHLDFVLADTADVIAQLRSEGHVVLLHCVAAQSRTPTVAAAYAMRSLEIPAPQAVAEIVAALPGSRPNRGFRSALRRLGQ